MAVLDSSPMLTSGPLARFTREEQPERDTATAALRTLFAGMFLVQAIVAGILAAVVLLVAGGSPGGGSILGPVLSVLAPLQLLLGAILPGLVARNGSKGSALSAALLSGVLLASPVWFLALALITGQESLPLLVIGFVVTSGYALGFGQMGRLGAKVAATARAQAKAREKAEAEETTEAREKAEAEETAPASR